MTDTAAEPTTDEFVITLRKPVQLGDLTFTEMRLREPTAGEMMAWDKLTGTEADIRAVAVVSGMPEPAVRLIGVRDLLAAARYITGFFGDAPGAVGRS